jgi:glyoxylase-like metal-dependent hydrolase (beta-lactamase superfamily II)
MQLAFNGEQGLELVKILLTHAHVDHAAATAELAERCHLPIEGPHRDDDSWIQGLPAAAAQFGFPPARAFVPTRWLQDGHAVAVGEVQFLPGHGHMSTFSAERKSNPYVSDAAVRRG